MEFVIVEVFVEDPKTGIQATHYVETRASLVHKEAWARHQEEDKGYRVLGARLWNSK